MCNDITKGSIKSLDDWREVIEVGYEFYKRKRGIENGANTKKTKS